MQCHQISSDAATADYKLLDDRDYLFAWPENNELLITRRQILAHHHESDMINILAQSNPRVHHTCPI